MADFLYRTDSDTNIKSLLSNEQDPITLDANDDQVTEEIPFVPDTDTDTDVIPTNVWNTISDESESESNEETPSTQIVDESEPDPSEFEYKNKWDDFRRIKKQFPKGKQRDTALDEWSLKYNQKSFEKFQQERAERSIFEKGFRGTLEHTSKTGYNIVAGGADFLIDTVNIGTDVIDWSTRGPIGQHIPDIPDIPRLPQYGGEGYQLVRGASSIILPSMVGGTLITGSAKGIHAVRSAKLASGTKHTLPWLTKLGQGIQKRWILDNFAKAGLNAGVTGTVDFVASSNVDNEMYKGANLGGMLQQRWPNTWKFLPPSIVAKDGGDPGFNRSAHIREGVFLGASADLLTGFAKIGINKLQWDNVIQPINKKAHKYFTEFQKSTSKYDEIVFDEDNPILDILKRGDAYKKEAYDSLGKAELQINPKPTKAVTGLTKGIPPDGKTVTPIGNAGIQGAMVDQARIGTDMTLSLTSETRLRTVITEFQRKIGLTSKKLSTRELVQSLAKQIRKVGPIEAVTPKGKKIASRTIDEQAEKLTEIILDPRMTPGSLKLLLNGFKETTELGIKKLNSVGEKALSKSIKKFQTELFDIDVDKARAFLLASEGGELADIAETALQFEKGSVVVQRATDRIIDRIKIIMTESKFGKFEAQVRGNYLKAWKKVIEEGDPSKIRNVKNSLESELKANLNKTILDSENFTNQLKAINEVNPDILRPFLAAYEFTDGNVDTIYKLNAHLQNKFGVFLKLFKSGASIGEDSILVNQMQGVLFNSQLGAPTTLANATIGNLTGLTSTPIAKILGSGTDVYNLRRTWVQYSAFQDGFNNSINYMAKIYRKAAKNAESVGSLIRDDLKIKRNIELNYLTELADAYAKQGQWGPSTMLSLYEDLSILSEHPWFRRGTNSMSALDGFNRAMIAHAEARGQAWDEMMSEGVEFTRETLKNKSDEIYKTFFDENDLITNKAVEYMSRETALNLDSAMSRYISKQIEEFPLLRFIWWFPKTTENQLRLIGKYTPGSAVSHFAHDTLMLAKHENKFKQLGKQLTGHIDKFEYLKSNPDFRPGLEKFMARYGKNINSKHAAREYASITSEIKGRQVIGTMTIGSTIAMTLSGNIRGNGHWDSNVQRNRKRGGWVGQTYRIPGTTAWRDYSWMGPIADIIAATVDTVDNLSGVSTTMMQDINLKLAYILGATLYNNSSLSELEPIQHMLGGNMGEINKFIASGVINPIIPEAGLRRDLNKLIAPELVRHNKTITDFLASDNKLWTQYIDRQNKLNNMYDPITGDIVGQVEEFPTRLRNLTRNPWKVHNATDPRHEWLWELEFDGDSRMQTSTNGAEYNIDQQEAILSEIGREGYWAKELTRIMNKAKNLEEEVEPGKTIKGYINILRYYRRENRSLDQKNLSYSKVYYETYYGIMDEIDRALFEAKKSAERNLRATPLFADTINFEQAGIEVDEAAKFGAGSYIQNKLKDLQKGLGQKNTKP